MSKKLMRDHYSLTS